MSSIIYYFSATGNSLWAAKKISESIEGTKLVSISTLIDEETIHVKEDFVGIVIPVYYNSLPEIVERFLKKINVDSNSYVYAVATLGAKSSNIFTRMSTLLSCKLSYGKQITMPANYIRMYSAPEEKNIKVLMKIAKKNVADIISDIKSKKVITCAKDSFIRKVLFSCVRKIWIKKLPTIDKGFNVDQSCTSCGLCEKVCPTRNIEIVNNHPKWNGKCQDCVACINLCPTKSIQIKNRTADRRRYKNPKIEISELFHH